MPKNLSTTGTTFPTQTAPVAGEPRTAGSIETPFQNAAERTAYLKDRLDFLDPDKGGARRLRRFATVAAMQASVDHPDRTFAVVDANGVLYQYDPGSELAEAIPAVVKPTDVGGGAGRWLMQAIGAFNTANGVPQLDANAKLPTARLAAADGNGKISGAHVANGEVAYAFKTVTSVFNVPNDTTFRDIPGTEITFSNLLIGDVICIDYTPLANPAATTDFLHFLARVTTPSASNSDGPTLTMPGINASYKRPFPVARFYTVAANGSHTVVLRVGGTVVNTVSSVDGVTCRLEVRRP